jgi:hypothetical protein
LQIAAGGVVVLRGHMAVQPRKLSTDTFDADFLIPVSNISAVMLSWLVKKTSRSPLSLRI